jgi:hypothetical protein
MITISYPTPTFKIKKEEGKEVIFDVCRKHWVTLTPEEWVRQNFLQYLVQVKQYPISLIAVERLIMLGDLRKRFDIVVYKNAMPWMMVECKEMDVELGEATIKQILNYNIKLQVEYLVITNGKSTFCLHLKEGKFEWLTAFPEFS